MTDYERGYRAGVEAAAKEAERYIGAQYVAKSIRALAPADPTGREAQMSPQQVAQAKTFAAMTVPLSPEPDGVADPDYGFSQPPREESREGEGCKECGGDGKVYPDNRSGAYPCPSCGGTGKKP